MNKQHVFFRAPRLSVWWLLAVVALCCCEPALVVLENSIASGGSAQTHALYAAKKKKAKKAKTKKRRKKKSRRSRKPPIPFLPDSAADTLLAPGVHYTKMIAGKGKYSVHVITVDYDETEENTKVEVLKAQELFNGLERVSAIAARRDSIGPDTVLAVANANFWKAYYNTPINPTVIRGEVLEMEQYKQWSSAFFDEEGKVYIDRFSIGASVRNRRGVEWTITGVNARHDSTGVVVYNSFASDTIPYVKPVSAEELSRETLENFTVAEYDSTESAPTIEDVMAAVHQKKREGKIEYGMYKTSVRYIGTPRVNRPLRCVVVAVGRGVMRVPTNGAVLSFGQDVPAAVFPTCGDTLTMLFQTNVHRNTPFEFAVGGTPRLVRNGKAAHEAQIEGSTARRFISGNLSRTALGVDKSNSVLYIVAVDGTHRANGTRGMALDELAAFMKQIGAHNALNLDGGGSVSLSVGGQNVVRIGGAEFNRKVSVALGVVNKYVKAPVVQKGAPPPDVRKKNAPVGVSTATTTSASDVPLTTTPRGKSVEQPAQQSTKSEREERLRRERERQQRIRQEQLRRRGQVQPEKQHLPRTR